MNKSNVLILDLETTNLTKYKRIANPWYNNIVAIGYVKNKLANTFYGIPDDNYLRELLCNTDVLVGHNLKFDLLYLWKQEGLQEWLRNGGRIFDTQLAEYYLSSFQNKYPALRDIAVNKYGCMERPKHIDRLLFDIPENQRVDYKQVSDIPKELVLEDVKNDVLDTEQVYLGQIAKAEQLGILDVLEFQMNYLLATTEMEFNGFFIDVETLQKNKKELEDRLVPIQKQFDRVVNKYIPIEVFNSQPRKGLHALFFGGEIKVVTKEPLLDNNGLPLMVKFGQKIGQARFKNVEKVLKINGLGVKVLDHWMTEKGNVSIDETVLQEIIKLEYITRTQQESDAVTVSKLLLDIRDISKQVSTYYTAVEELVYVIDQCIHGKFHHCATGTGRLSSSDPNLQNIPRGKGEGSTKEQFKTRFK